MVLQIDFSGCCAWLAPRLGLDKKVGMLDIVWVPFGSRTNSKFANTARGGPTPQVVFGVTKSRYIITGICIEYRERTAITKPNANLNNQFNALTIEMQKTNNETPPEGV